eukprot:scaffold2426_cov84-Isochrysis_galbana.AAC.1
MCGSVVRGLDRSRGGWRREVREEANPLSAAAGQGAFPATRGLCAFPATRGLCAFPATRWPGAPSPPDSPGRAEVCMQGRDARNRRAAWCRSRFNSSRHCPPPPKAQPPLPHAERPPSTSRQSLRLQSTESPPPVDKVSASSRQSLRLQSTESPPPVVRVSASCRHSLRLQSTQSPPPVDRDSASRQRSLRLPSTESPPPVDRVSASRRQSLRLPPTESPPPVDRVSASGRQSLRLQSTESPPPIDRVSASPPKAHSGGVAGGKPRGGAARVRVPGIARAGGSAIGSGAGELSAAVARGGELGLAGRGCCTCGAPGAMVAISSPLAALTADASRIGCPDPAGSHALLRSLSTADAPPLRRAAHPGLPPAPPDPWGKRQMQLTVLSPSRRRDSHGSHP